MRKAVSRKPWGKRLSQNEKRYGNVCESVRCRTTGYLEDPKSETAPFEKDALPTQDNTLDESDMPSRKQKFWKHLQAAGGQG